MEGTSELYDLWIQFRVHRPTCCKSTATSSNQPHAKVTEHDSTVPNTPPAAKSPPAIDRRERKETDVSLREDSQDQWAGNLFPSPFLKYFSNVAGTFQSIPTGYFWFIPSSYSAILLITFRRKGTGIVVSVQISDRAGEFSFKRRWNLTFARTFICYCASDPWTKGFLYCLQWERSVGVEMHRSTLRRVCWHHNRFDQVCTHYIHTSWAVARC